jgi:GTP cyclohydrolase II
MDKGERILGVDGHKFRIPPSVSQTEARVPVETQNYSAAPFEGLYSGRCTQIAYTVSPEIQAENGFTNPDILILVKTPLDPFIAPSSTGRLFDQTHFGDTEKIPLRISSACLPGSLGDTECDCHIDSVNYLKEIKERGVGVFVYLPQEALGRGLREKVRDHRLIYGVDDDGHLIPPVPPDEALNMLHPDGYDIRKYHALRGVFGELGLLELKFENLGESDKKRLEIVDQTGIEIYRRSEGNLPN